MTVQKNEVNQVIKLVPVKFQDGTVYIEGVGSAKSSEGSSIKEASSVDSIQKSLITAQKLTNTIKDFCGNTINSFHELGENAKPSRATIEFGLNISVEGDVYIIKSSSEASIKIMAEWNFDRE
ncbi:CU044_2847 family protein [Methanosarcina mazei]|uniref:Trypsin-co-occurring domain-containing protein n=1 Tax=Methanosarcina mazei TaxID=2209 RepID=A0A0F8KRG4_METMZ|nr:CU044_2847 family protein [Methanosarcina mazei]KKG83435.1 hypothetical protein DU55_14755 [Methanosarcina mazei]